MDDLYSREYWKLGFIYFNSDNPKMFVPKRIGIGWTLNFAHWMSWGLIGIFVCILVVLRFFIKK